MDQYSALYVVSDLHLGGSADRAIFQDSAALAALIDHVRTAPATGDVGLVLGGDVLDLLAEDGASGFSAASAAARVRSIVTRPVFKPVFDALRRLLATPRRFLVVVVGNHDVELTLPEVHSVLCDRLGARSGPPSGRLRFATDGTGYVAWVGDGDQRKRVLVLHGEVADVQNVIDHTRLAEVIRARKYGTEVPEFPEPIGTHIVLDVINPIKADYPIIDLFKPEFAGAASLASVLVHGEEGGKARWAGLWKAGLGNLRAFLRDKWKRTRGLLSDDGGAVGGHVERRGYDPRAEGDALVRQVLAGVGVEDIDDEELLALSDYALVLPWVTPDAEDLRKKWLKIHEAEQDDRQLSPWCEAAGDATLAYLQDHVGAEIDVVVAGHTHLRRSLRGEGKWKGRYFNSGTWIQLMKIPTDVVASAEAFEAWLARVREANTVARLVEAGLVFTQRTVVMVTHTPDGVRAGLAEVSSTPGERQLGHRLWLNDLEGSWTSV
jgi:UDP-2,3-diacylglucosamine pyrophosphatase LpxH